MTTSPPRQPRAQVSRSTSVPDAGRSSCTRASATAVSRHDGDGRRVHTGVHERTSGSGSILTAIFGSLAAAEYVIWEDATTPGPSVTVPDGGVAQLALS